MAFAVLALAASWPSGADAGNWTSSGPSSPGVITSVAVDGSGTVYAGASVGETVGGGVFRSYDRGRSWSPPSLTAENVTAVAAGPSGVVYAGTHRGSVFKSVSGGADWTQIVPPDPSNAVILLRTDPLFPNILYRATKARVSPGGTVFGELFRSADGGTSWTRLMAGQLFVRAFAIDPRSTNVLYAFTDVFRKSSDSGATWTRIQNALDMQAPNAFVVDPMRPETIYAGTFRGVLKSTDGGASFNPSGDRFGFAPIDHIVIARSQGHIYAGTRGDGIFVSTDAGGSWAPINQDLGGLVVSDLATDRPGAFVYAAFMGGVYSYQASVDVTTLSLNANHPFRVTVSARDHRTGRLALGLAIPQNDLFGYFSLPELTGDPSNPEIFVKIIDGRPVNGKYWVFYAGLTDVEYTLTVIEESTGQIRTYDKPAGSACGGFDTAAF